ncbi:hypothetical protein AT15_01290 [Kosmotoga arenicorallina S304]|uniref:ABC transporter domain-containing protein n=1 Tax=Kosmotoga arenicorallina S304 TaxID=1453497 RepID=A0A176K0E7_9BACT|nr:ABC transporter ATP-binding protein [Kosmotoga arenicorallina]OAA29940.1 hypothetical protein AT15_01290 [Kosmotoga arenicorallina S304]
MNKVVEVKDLVKKYPGFQLGPIDLEIPEGSIVGLIGPNGAGKTTLIKSMLNLVHRDAGMVRIMGMDLSKNEREIKDIVGYVGEHQYFYEDKRVSWLGNFVSSFYSNWNNDLFRELLEKYQIDPKKRARELSKGMRVKLSFAIAISHNPKVMLLDEPTSGLDPIVRREILEEMRNIAGDEKRSVLISSHITDDIDRIADYVIYLLDGKVALYSEKDSLLAEWKRIHYVDGELPDSLQNSLFDKTETAFGNSGITSKYSELKALLDPLLQEGRVKVENLGLDDILICLVGKCKK